MTEKSNETAHTLCVAARTHTDISGVTDVVSFDESAVVLLTDCGEMTLEGEGLHVGVLDISKGNVSVDGRVTALYYTDVNERRTRKKRALLS